MEIRYRTIDDRQTELADATLGFTGDCCIGSGKSPIYPRHALSSTDLGLPPLTILGLCHLPNTARVWSILRARAGLGTSFSRRAKRKLAEDRKSFSLPSSHLITYSPTTRVSHPIMALSKLYVGLAAARGLSFIIDIVLVVYLLTLIETYDQGNGQSVTAVRLPRRATTAVAYPVTTANHQSY